MTMMMVMILVMMLIITIVIITIIIIILAIGALLQKLLHNTDRGYNHSSAHVQINNTVQSLYLVYYNYVKTTKPFSGEPFCGTLIIRL